MSICDGQGRAGGGGREDDINPTAIPFSLKSVQIVSPLWLE